MVFFIRTSSCVNLVCRIFRPHGFEEKEIEKEIDVATEQRQKTSAAILREHS